MVIKFQSRASSDILMFDEVVRELLGIVGKDPQSRQGIITVEQLPDAIARLNKAIESDRARAREREQSGADEADEDKPTGMTAAVNLHQRGWPLLDMMTTSLEAKTPVTWGT